MNTREGAVLFVISLFVALFVKFLIIVPMLNGSCAVATPPPACTANYTAGGTSNITTSGTYGNATNQVTIPGLGAIDFGNPVAVGTALGLIIVAAGILAGAGGFVTSGTARGSVSMGTYGALFLGAAVLLVSQLYDVFTQIPVFGLPVLVVWVSAGMLCIADSAFGKLAGGTS